MSVSLTVALREGYGALLRELGELDRRGLARARVLYKEHRARSSERAEALLAVVLAYRAGPRAIWAPVLLDLLAPSILTRLRRLVARPPVLDPEDLRQAFVLELLEAAASIPLPDDPRFLQRQLMSRANQAVRRSLVAEQRAQSNQRPIEAADSGHRRAQRPGNQ